MGVSTTWHQRSGRIWDPVADGQVTNSLAPAVPNAAASELMLFWLPALHNSLLPPERVRIGDAQAETLQPLGWSIVGQVHTSGQNAPCCGKTTEPLVPQSEFPAIAFAVLRSWSKSVKLTDPQFSHLENGGSNNHERIIRNQMRTQKHFKNLTDLESLFLKLSSSTRKICRKINSQRKNLNLIQI